jgi:hypothetical protein
MRVAKGGVIAGLLAFGLVSAAAGEPLTPRQAGKQLYKRAGFETELLDLSGLDPAMAAQIEMLVETLEDPQVAVQMQSYGYYGAIAVVPDLPLAQDTMAISARLHSPAAALAGAVAGCNAMRPASAGECVAVALILPKRNKERTFTLSQEATQAFRDDWDEGDGPKYLAYSPATPSWVIAKGPGADAAAIERCNEKAAALIAADCVIGIAEE